MAIRCRHRGCAVQADDATALQAHIRTAHLPNAMVCTECGHQSPNRRAFTRHEKRHKTDCPHRCLFCTERFHRPDELGSHIVQKHSPALRQVVAFAVTHNHPAVVNQAAPENEPAQEDNVDPVLYQAGN